MRSRLRCRRALACPSNTGRNDGSLDGGGMRLPRPQLAALFALAVATHAQTSRGTVTGTVLDPSGAVIAAARVTLTGLETGVRLSTNTNDTGVYRFDAVDLGVYEIKVTHPGFRTCVVSGIGVQ